MKSKMLGGILLIVGTTIGGGMLALPIVTAQGGFWGASLLLIASWMVMTFSAFLLLEVNMWMPSNSNIILMAKNALGGWAEIIAWFCYLLLFYCLLAAYIAGGSDILHGLVSAMGLDTSIQLDCVLFTLILAAVVFNGIQFVDYTNRALMFIKISTFILLVGFIVPHMQVARLSEGQIKYLVPAFTVVMTSYGFSTLIPSLRSYFQNDLNKLRKTILIGSLIPLACYLAWVAAIFGGIPFSGEFGLLNMTQSDHSTLALTQSLIHELNNSSVTSLTRIFTSICVVTSFLGVSLCVVDFLADGFRMDKTGMPKLFLHVATFIPPLVIALIYPTAFIVGLNYAGICLAVLIILFPALMVWRGRYIKKIKAEYQVIGGKLPIIICIIVSFLIIYQGIFWRA
jgi:tyrosine-specific transport protein